MSKLFCLTKISPFTFKRPGAVLINRCAQDAARAPFSSRRFSSSLLYQPLGGLSPDHHSEPGGKRLHDIGFDNHCEIYRDISTPELLRRYLLLSFLRLGPVARNSSTLFGLSQKIFGKRLATFFLDITMFRHFCGGQTLEELLHTSKKLTSRSLGTIVDYAAESDESAFGSSGPTAAWFDANTELTKQTIRTCSVLMKEGGERASMGFIAAKATALCSPDLLRRVSKARNFSHYLFMVAAGVDDVSISQLTNPTRHADLVSVQVSMPQFVKAVLEVWPALTQDEAERMFRDASKLPGQCDSDSISYFQWTAFFSVEGLARLSSPVLSASPQATSSIAESWVQGCQTEWSAAVQRMRSISSYAAGLKVRLLVDAEQTFYQPAIDALALVAMEEFNNDTNGGVVYNTYQMYLKNAGSRLQCDVARADALGYKFAAKLVRGAYMVQEARVANEQRYENPVFGCIEDTHASYDAAAEMMVSRLPTSELLFGTHNEQSVKRIAALLAGKAISPSRVPLSFAQLLGMCDHISLSLAQSGCQTFKYVPYGPIDLVMPYLVRRAEENSSILGGSARETKLMGQELKKRLLW